MANKLYHVFKDTGMISPQGEHLTVILAASELPVNFPEPAAWLNTSDLSIKFLQEGEWT